MSFQDGLKRPKNNVVDQFLLWEQLSDQEKIYLRQQVRNLPEPLTNSECIDWLSKFEGIGLCSDAYIPFRDNIDRAHKNHVEYVVQTGGSKRDNLVIEAAEQYGMTMINTGVRLFLH